MSQIKFHTNSISTLNSFLLKAYKLSMLNLSDTNPKFRAIKVFVTLNLKIILCGARLFCSTMLSNTKRQWYLNKIRIWSNGGTILTRESKILGEKPVPVTLCLSKALYGLAWR